MKKRLVSLLMALVLCLSLLPATALAAPSDDVNGEAAATGYVAPNELWVGGTNVVAGGYWTTNEDGSLTVSDSNNYNVYYDGDGNLWLNNANIVGQGSSGHAATGIYAYYDEWVDTDIALTIHLAGENSVSRGYPIYVHPWGGSASLTITGQGSLNATATVGGNGGIFVHGDTSSLTIENGADVTVNSARSSAVTIVADAQGMGTLTIDNATLRAYGHVIDEPDESYSICFSYSGNSDNIVDGSRVLRLSGNSVIYTDYMQATYTRLVIEALENEGGMIFDGKNGTVYGDVTLREDLEIAEGETLTIGEDASLTVPEGKTLTNNGTITNDGTIINNGTVTTEEGGTLTNNGSLDCNHHFGGTATCTEKAKCDLCGAEFGDFLPHSLTKTEAKAPTCTEEGNEAYWTCGTCGKYFSDASGDTEIAKDSWIISAINHDWNDAVYTWSDDGSTCTATRACKHDSAHTETAVAKVTAAQTKAPTCTENGETTYTAVFEADWAMTQTKVLADIPATGHSLTKTEAKAPSCTEAGNQAYWTCGTCEKLFADGEGKVEISQADTVIPAAGHTLTKIEAKAPTCTEDGNQVYWTCGTCEKLFTDGEGKTEITPDSTVLPALGHDYKDGVCTRCHGKDPDYVPPTDPKAPAQTGETGNPVLWIFLMALSLASIAVMTVLRRQKHRA